MKKALTLLISLFLTCLVSFGEGTYVLPRGSHIRVYPNSTISTLTHQEGDRVYFLNPSDLWIDEKNIIPKNSVFEGVITMLKMPIQGIDGAMAIQIIALHYPNGEITEFPGILQFEGSTTLGGKLAPPISYNYAIHRQHKVWSVFKFPTAALQYVPSGEYEFGQHFTLKTNDASYIITTSDFEFH